jgi:hypothetical protein
MKKYIIVDNKNLHYFIEYINSFNQYLECDIINYQNSNFYSIINNENNILFFIQKINIPIHNIKSKIFVINTEQLSHNRYINFLIKYSKSNINILDYSKENIDIFNNKYYLNNIYYLPYIYNKNEILNIEKINDICCIYSSNKYRLNIINKIKNIKYIDAFYEERDKILFSYKILINISYNLEYKIFEVIRCYRCLFNKMIIISDHKYNENLIDYKKHILFTDYENIPILAEKVLNNYEYYYKLLDLDNIDIDVNKVYINNLKNLLNI